MSKAIQSFTTSEAVAFFWAMLALRRLVLVDPRTMPDVCDVGGINIEWLSEPAYEKQNLTAKSALLTMPLHSGHAIEFEVTIATTSTVWVPFKIRWREFTTRSEGSFSFAGTAETIMVCDLCGHEFSPMATEWPVVDGFPNRKTIGCYHCPAD